MRGSPKFSVIIPTYNRFDFLKQALDSVWAQTFTDYEVVVVDDGSTDGTHEWLSTQAKRVRVVMQPNLGPGAARNAGVRNAGGTYVAFLDSDDLWFPWTLDVFACAIQQYRCPNVLAGPFVEFRAVNELSAIKKSNYEALYFADYIASSNYSFSVGSGTCVLNRSALATTRFLEDRLNAEDHDLILRMGSLRGFVQVVAPITLAWRRHPLSETGNFVSSVSGALRLLSRERSDAYPGGPERSRERHRILARHIRPVALRCVEERDLKQGWELYRSIFGWNVDLGHWKYLLAFPIFFAFALLHRRVTSRASRRHAKAPGSI